MRRFYPNKRMTRSNIIPTILFFLVVFGLWSCSQLSDKSKTSISPEQQPIIATISTEPIQPIPLELKLDEKKVELGDQLFHDPQLSGNNSISCASCHALNQGGTDRLARSIGIQGTAVPVNSPTVYNSGFNFRQFWDGRARTLEEQIEGPINAEAEMGSNWPDIVSKLKQSPEYTYLFNQTYTDGINRDNIKNAIATFERSLNTPNSRFDRFLRGDESALTSEEKEGYRRFKEYGCVSCHQGINVGGNMFQTFGVMRDYFKESVTKKQSGVISKADLGRYNVTGKEEDRYVFKVPSLRNASLTWPYFHDGSATSLEEAVLIMGQYQLGRQLSDEDIELIIKFIDTLTGEYQGQPLWQDGKV